jgi:hypothetical protein
MTDINSQEKGEEFCKKIPKLEVYQYHIPFLKICQLLQGASPGCFLSSRIYDEVLERRHGYQVRSVIELSS